MHAPYQQRLSTTGTVSMNGSRKRGANTALRSARQRRKAYVKAEDALIVAAWRKWRDIDGMPESEKAALHKKIERLHQQFFS